MGEESRTAGCRDDDNTGGTRNLATRRSHGTYHNQRLDFFYAAFSTILLALPSDLLVPAQVVGDAGLCQAGSGTGTILFQLLLGFLLDCCNSYVPEFLLAATLPLIATVGAMYLIPEVRILGSNPLTIVPVGEQYYGHERCRVFISV